jgi:glutathione S-transferase
MRLLQSDVSPYVRKVRVTLHETGQEADVEMVKIATTALNPDPRVLTANPSGRIPALERDDGPTLYDSRVICRFLDDRARANLYPASRLWDVLTLEATGDGIMDSTVAMSYEMRLRPEEKQFSDWIEAQWAKAERSMAALESRWMGLLSGPVTMGHISLGCALAYIDFRHGGRDWRARHATLANWFEGFAARPSMQATAPQG